jgi:hypothetical protein
MTERSSGPNRQMRRAMKARARHAFSESKRPKFYEQSTDKIRTRGGAFGGSKFHTSQAIRRRVAH